MKGDVRMATKEQEQGALEKIREIVSELGEKSYVGTAFEGCFEIAEENIMYDAAFSWKGRVEIAETEVSKLRYENEMLRKARKDLEFLVGELDKKYRETCLRLKRWEMPDGIREKLEGMVIEALNKSECEVRMAADGMADAIEGIGQKHQVEECITIYRNRRRDQVALKEMNDFFIRLREEEAL